MAQGLMDRWRATYAPRTVYQFRRELANLLRHFERFGTKKDVREHLPTARKPAARQQTATPEEIAKLIAVSPPWIQLFVRLCSQLALRFSEAIAASERYYDREHQTITVPSKGHQNHTLPVPPEIAQLFDLAPDREDLDTPFVWKLNGKRLTGTMMRYRFRQARTKAGITADIKPHDLRRTTANALYDLTKDIRAVQSLLGHTAISTTAYYLKDRNPEELRPLLDQLRSWKHFKKEEPIQ